MKKHTLTLIDVLRSPIEERGNPTPNADAVRKFVSELRLRLVRFLDSEESTYTRNVTPCVIHWGPTNTRIQFGTSVYGFVDKDNQLRLPAGWKTPSKHLRGDIESPGIFAQCGQFGVTYYADRNTTSELHNLNVPCETETLCASIWSSPLA